MPIPDFDLADLMEALQEPETQGAAFGFTSGQLEEALGWSNHRVIRNLKRLILAGRVETIIAPKVDIVGRRNWSAFYRLRKDNS